MLRIVSTLVSLAAAVSAQAVTWLEGNVATSRALRSVPEANPGAVPTTILTDLQLLPFEINGRTAQQELDATVSRRIVRDGLTRVELPGGGRLFAYRRSAAQVYGYLWIDAAGAATVLIELPAAAGQSPFLDRIAVSPDGLWAVAVSAIEDRLFVLRLDGGTFASTGAPSRTVISPSEIESRSLMPGRRFAFFATDDERMRRLALADGGVIEDVSPPIIAGARMKSELALSGDGTTAVYLYGVQPAFSLFLVRESGGSLRLNAPIAKYEEPGYLPEGRYGPRMLLNFDGSRLMYTDSSDRDEIYLLDTSGATATTHVTGDHNFEPYIGIGIFPTFAAATLVLGVGDPDQFDVVSATTGSPQVTNLTMTSGNTQPPFSPGSLDPEVIAGTPSGHLLVADHPLGSTMRLLRFDPAQRSAELLATDLTALPGLGDARGARPDVLVATTHGDLALLGTDGSPLLETPSGVRLATDVLMAAGFRILSVATSNLSATVLATSDGSLIALPPVAGRQRAFATGAGNLLVDGPGLLHVSPTGAVPIATTGGVRHVLSGGGV